MSPTFKAVLPFRRLSTILCLSLLSACKVVIDSGLHGEVVSTSGQHDCEFWDVCEVEILDTDFEDQWTAIPQPGWEFVEWRKGPSRYCGGQQEACQISTKILAALDNGTDIVRADVTFYLEPVYRAADGLSDLNTLSAPEESAEEVKLTELAEGDYITYWGVRDPDDINNDSGLAQRVSREGFPFGVLWPVAPQTWGQSGVESTQHRLARLADSTLVYAWTQSAGESSEPGVYFRMSGYFAGSDSDLSETLAAADGSRPQVLALQDGGFVIAWTESDGESGDTLFASWYDASGGLANSRQQISAGIDASYEQLSIVQIGNGRVAFAYHEVNAGGDDDILLSLHAANGASITTATQIAASGSQRQPRLLALESGDFLLAWQSADGAVEVTTFDASGVQAGLPVNLIADSIDGDLIKLHDLAGGNIVVTWTDAGTLYGRLYDSSFQPLTTAVSLSEAATTLDASSADSLLLADGSMLAAWIDVEESGSRVYSRRSAIDPG